MDFGDKLKQIRRKHNLTQLQMCEKLHMEQSSYSRYETNRTIPTADLLSRVINVFDVTTDWLMQPANKQITCEIDSANNGVDAIIANENHIYYNIPKDMFDTFMTQQKSLEMLLQKLIEKL